MRARVINGRLVVEEPTTLPDGTVLDLILEGEGDDLTPEERGRLDAALSRSAESASVGQARLAAEVIHDLWKRS